MIKDFLEYLFNRGHDLAEAEHDRDDITSRLLNPEEFSDYIHVDKHRGPIKLSQQVRASEPVRATASLSTLPGLLDFVAGWLGADTPPPELAMMGLRVAETEVEFCDGWDDLERPLVVASCTHSGEAFPLGRFMDAEEFSVNLRARTADGGDREKLLAAMEKVTLGQTKSVTRLGAVARLEIKVAGQEDAAHHELPLAWNLALRRTFPEIDQPQGEYVLRVKLDDDQPAFCLVDGGGGTWKHAACVAIRSYLAEEIESRKLGLPVW